MKTRSGRFKDLGIRDKDVRFIAIHAGDDAAAHGLVAAFPVGKSLQFLPVGVDPAVAGGRLLAAESGVDPVVRFLPGPGIAIDRIRTASSAAGAVSRFDDGSCELALTQTGNVALHLTNGQTTLLTADLSGVGVVSPPRKPSAPGVVRVPAFTAPSAVTRRDTWLQAELAHHRDMKDAWHSAVGAGAFARFARHAVPIDERTALAGHHWMASLSESGREALRLRAHARVDGMWARLEGLTATPSGSRSRWWRSAFLRLCVERDQFESVWHLLSWYGEDPALSARVGRFDETAGRVARDVPFPPFVDDEQLRRSSRVNPTSWWVRGVAP